MTNGGQTPSEKSSLGRRRTIAAAAAVVAGLLYKASEKVASAADGGNMIIGATNTSSSSTALVNTPGTGVTFLSDSGVGGSGAGVAVRGRSSSSSGVEGESQTGTGVFGISTSGTGVAGHTVQTGNLAHGVLGSSVNGTGVGAITQGGIAVQGTAVQAGGLAGKFAGSVVIEGALSVTGIKSAIVPSGDGTYRRFYCLESPESYFEDIGRSRLQQGKAQVRLEPGFAEAVQTSDYDVQLTPYGDCQGLFVVDRGPLGFNVAESRAGISSIEFGYRVTAKRRDVQAPRLERTTIKSGADHRSLPIPQRPSESNPPR
jgi:hypothetical protein